jgi:hypothetical protein
MSNPTFKPGVDNADWALATDNAKEAAANVGEMASHAASAVGAMARQAASDAGKKADDLTASAGAGIQDLGDKLSKSSPRDGMLGNASRMFARRVRDSGQYIERSKLSGMTEDVAQFIRKNPIPAVLIALGVGWFAARKLRT